MALDENVSTSSSSDISSKEEENSEAIDSTCAPIKIEECRNSNKRARPSYLIERDCHVFGGCMDDDAQDEFFISSGAIYQSWPYVYEPGFQLVPLIEIVNYPISKSATQINFQHQNMLKNNNHYSANFIDSHDELPSYSINNYEINMLHVDVKKKKRRTRRKKQNKVLKPALVNRNSIDSSVEEEISSFSSFLSCSMSNESNSSYAEESSDDSESIIAYKKRHAAGLNFNSYYNRCNSHLNLSNTSNDNTNKSSILSKQARSSNDNYKKNSRESLKIYQRLATSYYDNNPSNNLKRIRFLSQKRMDFNHQADEYIYNNNNNNTHSEQHYLSQNFIF